MKNGQTLRHCMNKLVTLNVNRLGLNMLSGKLVIAKKENQKSKNQKVYVSSKLLRF